MKPGYADAWPGFLVVLVLFMLGASLFAATTLGTEGIGMVGGVKRSSFLTQRVVNSIRYETNVCIFSAV